jgi:hypothetical protein
MRKLLLIIAILFVAVGTNAAVVTFEKVTTYVDGTPVPAAKLPNITYTVWYGPTATDLSTRGPSSTTTVIVAPDPAAGSTAWYAVSAGLDGVESAKCVPASKTVAPLTPAAPPGCLVR